MSKRQRSRNHFKKLHANNSSKALAAPLCYERINLYFQDESRFGLHTKYGRGLTAKVFSLFVLSNKCSNILTFLVHFLQLQEVNFY
ncbi:MAG: hypothetical protein IPI42_03550 [Saprospiraceae bacterium]|nr:hypothetical protein [Candidatus Parvibacillus calidus]